MPAKYRPCLLLLIVLTYVCAPGSRSFGQAGVVAGNDEYPSLQSFPMDQSGEHVFHFRQTQSGEMTLLLQIEGPTGKEERQELTHLQTVVEVTLLNHAGRTICQAAGSPADGVRADNWVLRTSRGEAAFWHRGCAEIKLKRSESYTLTVRLRDVDPKTPKIKATPLFERSDNYVP